MRILPILLGAAGLGMSVAYGVSAGADSGDGNLGCNTYEICFSRDTTNTTYQKHFWYNANHDGYQFTNVSTGAGGQGYLKDNAAQVRNRDGSCDVKVIDTISAWPDDYHVIPNNSVWTMLKDDTRNQNNKHERVNC